MVENATFETLKMLHYGHTISEISKFRKVNRSSVYKTISSLIKKGWVIKKDYGVYNLTENGYKFINIKKEVKNINPISNKKILKVKTELSYCGDIRNLKEFLLNNIKYLPDVPEREKHRDIPLKIRRAVIKRDNSICVICGKEGKEIDHIIPFSAGGKHEITNLRLLCRECHCKTFSEIGKLNTYINNMDNNKLIYLRL